MLHQHHAFVDGAAASIQVIRPECDDAESCAKGLGAKEIAANNRDSQAVQGQDQDAQPSDKLRATLSAALARHGFGLHELAGGEYLVHKWDCSRLLVDLSAVRRFAKLVTGGAF